MCVENKGIRVIVGVAAAFVVSGLAGGSAISAAAAGGAVGEFGPGVKIPRSQTAVRVRGSNDSLKAKISLRRLGYHPTTLDSRSDAACDRYADGEAQRYLMKHRCVSINRTLIEIREKNYAVRFATATIEMPDSASVEGFSLLLEKAGGGDVIPLFPKDGKYRHVPFTSASSHITWHGTVVINTRVQGVGRTPSAALLSYLGVSVLFSLD